MFIARYGSLFLMFALATALSSLPIREISSRNNATTTRGHGAQLNRGSEMNITGARARPDSDLTLRTSGAHIVV